MTAQSRIRNPRAHQLSAVRRGGGCGGWAARIVAVALVIVLTPVQMHALNAAGAFTGTPISGVQSFVEKLKGNLVWLGGTTMGLVVAVVGIMFMAGHRVRMTLRSRRSPGSRSSPRSAASSPDLKCVSLLGSSVVFERWSRWGPLGELLLAPPPTRSLAGQLCPSDCLDLPSLHSIIEAIAKGFFGALAGALVPSWLKHGTVATVQQLVALRTRLAGPTSASSRAT